MHIFGCPCSPYQYFVLTLGLSSVKLLEMYYSFIFWDRIFLGWDRTKTSIIKHWPLINESRNVVLANGLVASVGLMGLSPGWDILETHVSQRFRKSKHFLKSRKRALSQNVTQKKERMHTPKTRTSTWKMPFKTCFCSNHVLPTHASPCSLPTFRAWTSSTRMTNSSRSRKMPSPPLSTSSSSVSPQMAAVSCFLARWRGLVSSGSSGSGDTWAGGSSGIGGASLGEGAGEMGGGGSSCWVSASTDGAGLGTFSSTGGTSGKETVGEVKSALVF